MAAATAAEAPTVQVSESGGGLASVGPMIGPGIAQPSLYFGIDGGTQPASTISLSEQFVCVCVSLHLCVSQTRVPNYVRSANDDRYILKDQRSFGAFSIKYRRKSAIITNIQLR